MPANRNNQISARKKAVVYAMQAAPLKQNNAVFVVSLTDVELAYAQYTPARNAVLSHRPGRRTVITRAACRDGQCRLEGSVIGPC